MQMFATPAFYHKIEVLGNIPMVMENIISIITIDRKIFPI